MLFCMMDWNAAAKSCGCWKSTPLRHLGGFVGEKFSRGYTGQRVLAWEKHEEDRSLGISFGKYLNMLGCCVPL